jgi:hypothetical protein
MSNIPKGDRSKSKLDALHHGYAIRKRIAAELKATFGYSQKQLEKKIKEMTSHVKNEEEREAMSKKIRELEESYAIWFIESEREYIASLARGITGHLRGANTISSPQNMSEYIERRLEMDRAMMCCNQLQDELECIAASFPADKNKYMNIVEQLKKEYLMIRALRQSDNRFLKKIPQGISVEDFGQLLLRLSAAWFANVNNNGNCNNNNASNAGGVRPDFTTAQHRAKFPACGSAKGRAVHSDESADECQP